MAVGAAGYVFRPRDASGVAEVLDAARSESLPVAPAAPGAAMAMPPSAPSPWSSISPRSTGCCGGTRRPGSSTSNRA